MLNKYKSLDKVSVTELTINAKVSRSTFYTHYNNIADVAADIKNETARVFFEHKKVRGQADAKRVFDDVLRYLKKNDHMFKLLFKSPEVVSFALELGLHCRQKLVEMVKKNIPLKDQYLLELEVSILADGLALSCIRYFRGELDATLDDIFECATISIDGVLRRRQLLTSFQ